MRWRAVFFDLDGTLLDTEAIGIAAGLAAFGRIGLPPDLALLHALVGKDHAAVAAVLSAALPPGRMDDFVNAWLQEQADVQTRAIPVKPGALDLLSQLSLPRALVTSSVRVSARRKLAATGLPAFDHVVTFDDVDRPKPAPEPYLLAARLVAADPADCLVFEDSDTGAEAAHRAGMAVVQVPDVAPTHRRFATWVAPDLLTGARLAGLIAA